MVLTSAQTRPRLWRVDESGTLHFTPHPGQWRAWQSERRFIFMLAGTQGGKTSFGPLWLRREIQRRGPGDYLAVTSTFPLLKLKMLPEFLRLFRDTLRLGEWKAADRAFEFSQDGARKTYGSDESTRVIFGSATNSESLESATAKAAWLDEVGQDDFRLESWEAIQRRLALNEGRVLGGTTLYNLGWLKQQVYEVWQAGDRDIEIVQFASIQNPAFPPAEFERLRRTLPKWKASMFLLGEYDRPAGLIYSDFIDAYREEGGHKVKSFDIPPEWPAHVGVDFGAVNNARLVLRHDPQSNVYYLTSEVLEGGKTTAEHAKAALDAVAGMNARTWHGGSRSETQQRMDWNAAGVPLMAPPLELTENTNTDSIVEAGIDRVIALFKTFRLYIFDTCKGVLDELGSYSRELDEMQQPTAKIRNKQRYHRLDALRYVVQGATDEPDRLVAY